MNYFRTILLIILSLFIASCTAPPKAPIALKQVIKPIPIPTSTLKSKSKTFSLEQSLENIGAKIGDPIFIRIFKKEKKLELWVKPNEEFKLCKTYTICTYSGDLGPKLKQGDKQSPEGFYTVSKKQLKPNSKYHLGLILDFPNKYDKYQKRTGSYLMIHGECSSTGCYAMGNRQIEEIYKMAEATLKNTQKKLHVHIFPFEMTPKNMKLHDTNRWYDFWVNLKLGHDIFERYNVVPIIKASKDKYRFFVKKKQDKLTLKRTTIEINPLL